MFFILSKALLVFISPFTWLVLALAGFFFLKNEKWKRRCKRLSIVIFLVFTNTFVYLEVCRLWEVHGTPPNQLKVYDVGVVLTGMAEYDSYLQVVSIRRGADRMWQALNLYHQGKIKKILISGDSGYVTDRGLHEAAQFKQILINWGIPERDIIIENKSRNTHENAVETTRMLRRYYPHASKILIISSGTHIRRARACFKKEGLACDTYSTDLYTSPNHSYFWDQLIVPNVSTLEDWNSLIKEFVGYVTYDIVGYI